MVGAMDAAVGEHGMALGGGIPQTELSVARGIGIPVGERGHPPLQPGALDDEVDERGLRHVWRGELEWRREGDWRGRVQLVLVLDSTKSMSTLIEYQSRDGRDKPDAALTGADVIGWHGML